VSGFECESERWVEVLCFLLADPEFQRIEEVYARDETTQGGRKFSRFSSSPLDLMSVHDQTKRESCSRTVPIIVVPTIGGWLNHTITLRNNI